jgi:hypothetical protein
MASWRWGVSRLDPGKKGQLIDYAATAKAGR